MDTGDKESQDMEEHEGMEPEDLVEVFKDADSVQEALCRLKDTGFLRQVEDWDQDRCTRWLKHYLGEEEGILGVPAEAQDFEYRLYEALLARCSSLGMTLDLAGSRFLCEVACRQDVLKVPRRYMLPAYLKWIGNDFVAGIVEYRSYALRMATADERIAVAEASIAATRAGHHTDEEWCTEVVLEQLEVAWRHAPGKVLPWCEYLEQGGTLPVEHEALVAHYRSRALAVAESVSSLQKKVDSA